MDERTLLHVKPNPNEELFAVRWEDMVVTFPGGNTECGTFIVFKGVVICVRTGQYAHIDLCVVRSAKMTIQY